MRVMLLLAICAVLFLNAGCQTAGTELINNGMKSLESRQAVISSFRGLTYTEIVPNNKLNFWFDEKSSVVAYEGRRFFAKGFILPKECSRCSVTITSFVSGTLEDPAVVYPEVWLLNSDFQKIHVFPNNRFAFREMSGARGLQATFFIENTSGKGPNRLLIVNRFVEDAALVMSQSNISRPATVIVVPVPGGMGAISTIPTGSSKAPVAVKASPVGDMDLIVQSYKPVKIEKSGNRTE